MKSLERRFREIEEKNPNLSSYMVFTRTITDQHFSKDRLTRYFNILVNQDDYAINEKKAVLEHLMILNKQLKRTKNRYFEAHRDS